MSLSVTYLEALEVVQITQDGASVFIRRDQSADLLARFMRVLADTAPGGFQVPDDMWSRKAPDTTGLRLVDGDVA